MRVGGVGLRTAWAFKGKAVEDHSSLLECYGDGEFDSPTRSTIPLLELWRCPGQRMRELSDALHMVAPQDVLLDFEHLVHPPRGDGRPSQTDLMAVSGDVAIAIETKWTEPRYEEVAHWLGSSKNRAEVLRGWCDLLECCSGAPVRETDVRGLPYQMVHRAASACHVANVSRRWLVYIVFETTAEKRTKYLKDLTRLRDVLGPSSSLGIALAEGTVDELGLLRRLRARWDDGDRGLHMSVQRGLRAGDLLTARLGHVHLVTPVVG